MIEILLMVSIFANVGLYIAYEWQTYQWRRIHER